MHRPALPIVLVVSMFLAAGCGGAERATVVAQVGGEGEPAVDAAGAVPDGIRSRSERVGLVVDVAGQVRRPGVYEMPHGARVHDAIRAAGGARAGADLGGLNRAAPLVDGQQVVVAAADDTGAAPRQAGAADAVATVSINTGDAAALDTLPGIGPVTAERIVADRAASGPFASIDDLARVPGIGPATVEALRGVATT